MQKDESQYVKQQQNIQNRDQIQQKLQIKQQVIRKRSILSLQKFSQISNDENNQQLQNHDQQKNQPKLQQIQNKVQNQEINRYKLYRQAFNFNWNMEKFDLNKAVEQFSKLDHQAQLQDSEEEQKNNQNQQKSDENLSKKINLRIYQTNTEKSSLINKKTLYFLKGRDRNGQFVISRYFKQFVLLRQKLVDRWPGCFIPPIMTKKIGNNQLDLILIRIKFINNFLKKLQKMPEIYYSTQCEIFFKRDTQQFKNSNGKIIQQHLQLKNHTNQQLLEKYKHAFSNSIQELTQQQQNIAIQQIKQLQYQLKKWKIDLIRFKDQIRSLISAKDKYYQAMTRLNTILIPQYEQIVLEWVNYGLNLSEQNQIKQLQLGQQVQGYLLNTQQYGSALKDTAISVQNYNQSLWIIYDIFKFQLKQIDSILQSILSYEFLVKQKQYLIRNIQNNKQQIESLSGKKTTLKLFLMTGSIDQKKQRLTKQSEQLQDKLKVVKDLLNFVLNVLINSIEQFHNDRAQSYKKMLAKSSRQELVLIKKLMDFHLFELQLFERKRTLFRNKESVNTDQQSKQFETVQQ